MPPRRNHTPPPVKGDPERVHITEDPTTLDAVIAELFARRGYGRVQGDQQLRAAWAEVAGAELAQQTRVKGLRNGVLQIGVASAALRSQLNSFRRLELLERLQQAQPQLKIRDLKFRS